MNIKNIINLNVNEYRIINFINIKPEKNIKIITQSEKTSNNPPIPVNTILNYKNIYKKNISNQKESSTTLSNKNKIKLYTQKIDVRNMKESPPNMPVLFLHNYSLEEENIISKSNETFGKLNKDIVPITFYGHLMINQKILYNRNKYIKTSFVQRNKKKLLTIIYYSP